MKFISLANETKTKWKFYCAIKLLTLWTYVYSYNPYMHVLIVQCTLQFLSDVPVANFTLHIRYGAATWKWDSGAATGRVLCLLLLAWCTSLHVTVCVYINTNVCMCVEERFYRIPWNFLAFPTIKSEIKRG